MKNEEKIIAEAYKKMNEAKQPKKIKVTQDLYTLDQTEIDNYDYQLLTKKDIDNIVSIYLKKGEVLDIDEDGTAMNDDGSVETSFESFDQKHYKVVE